MTAFLTINTLFYICISLFILLIVLWVYVQNINKRLTQSIKLINDLYKLSQSQSKVLADLVGESQVSERNDDEKENVVADKAPITEQLIAKIEAQVKASIGDDLNCIESRATEAASKRVLDLEQRILELENQTLQLQQDSPELKMYNRANELVKQGANIEDVMEATQLPRAEVEVLVGLHSHKKKKV